MAFSWDNFPYTNFHELNLDWFIKKFKEIFDEWDSLYSSMLTWKEATDKEIQTLLDRSEQLIEVYETWVNTTQQNSTDIGNLQLVAIQLSQRINEVRAEKLDKPTNTGSAGMTPVLQNDNTTLWQNITADPTAVSVAVADFLNEHPEALTGFVTPEMYGAEGDGETDDSEAFQDMFDALDESTIRVIILSAKTYCLENTVTCEKDCVILGRDSVIKVSGSIGILFTGSQTIIGTTSASANKGEFSLTTTITDAFNADANYLLINPTSYSWSTERDYYKQGEFINITEISSGTLSLGTPLMDSYPSSCEIYKIIPIHVTLNGIIFEHTNNTTTVVDIVKISNGYQCLIENCEFKGANRSQIYLDNSKNISIGYCSGFSNKADIGTNYGILVGSCEHITINNCKFTTGRHGFTVGNGTMAIPSRYVKFISCESYALTPSDGAGGFDAHSNGEFIEWNGCKGDAISVQSSNSIIKNCEFNSNTRYALYCNKQTRGKTSIENCIVNGGNNSLNGAIYYNMAQFQTGITNTFELVIDNCVFSNKIVLNSNDANASKIDYKLYNTIFNSDVEIQYAQKPFDIQGCTFNGFLKTYRARNSEASVFRGNFVNYYMTIMGDAGQNAFPSVLMQNNIFTFNSQAYSVLEVNNMTNLVLTNNDVHMNITGTTQGIFYLRNAVNVIIAENTIDVKTNSNTLQNRIYTSGITNNIIDNNLITVDGVLQT